MPIDKAVEIVVKSLAKHNDEEMAAKKLCQVAAEFNSDDCTAAVIVFP